MANDRRVTRRRVVQGLGGLAAASAIGGIGAPAVHAQGATKIKIGNVNSVSGNFARYGQELQRGIDLAIERINATGLKVGNATYTFEQQVLDDKSDATTAARMVERAVINEKSHAVLASLGSVIVKACIPVAQRLQFPMLTHWAQVDGVFSGQKGNPFLYGAMPPFSRYYTRITEMCAKLDKPAIKKAAMITTNDELGVFTANDYFPSDLKKAGLENLGTEFFPPKSQEYAPALERLRAKNPDVFVINCYTPDIIGVFKEMQSINWFPPVIVVEAPTQLPQTLGDSINGVLCPVFWDPTLDKTRDEFIGTSRDFAKLYKAKYNAEPPDFVAACGANNIVIYARVLQAAGKIDDPKAINAAFRALQGETFFSPVKFADDGLNYEGAVYPGQFQKGELVMVYPPEVKTHDLIHPYPNMKRT